MKRFLALLSICLVATATACGGGGDDSGSADEEDALTIFAVGALEPELEALVAAYADEVPGAPIEFTFGGAADLLEQIEDGEKPDLFIGTSRNVEALDEAGNMVGEPTLLGFDLMEIVTPLGNPAGVTGLDAFGDNPFVNSGLCEPDTGCGEFSESVLNQAGITPAPDSIEPGAGPLLAKVAEAQLDAGILWRTQATSRANAVTIIEIPEDVNRRVDYEIATVSVNPAADDFFVWLGSDSAKEILAQRGLLPADGDAG